MLCSVETITHQYRHSGHIKDIKAKCCDTWQSEATQVCAISALKLPCLLAATNPIFTHHFYLLILWCMVTFYNLAEWNNTFIQET